MLALVTFASPAQAQQPCPGGPGPGERIVGVRDNVPLCAEAEGEARPAGPSVAEWNAGVAELSRSLRGMSADDWRAFRDVSADINKAIAGPGGGARPAKAFRPGWRYYLKAGECSATYFAPNGFVRVAGPTRGLRFTSITFHTPAIKRPPATTMIQAYLENGDMADGKMTKATVRAATWASIDREAGFISFVVPSPAALVDSLADRMVFKVAVRGSLVVDLQWAGGREAKARLGQCLGLR